MKDKKQKIKFECGRCGYCCREYNVQLSHFDMLKIMLKGYKREFFLEQDGACVFLKTNDDGKTGCQIYDARPKICRKYQQDCPQNPKKIELAPKPENVINNN